MVCCLQVVFCKTILMTYTLCRKKKITRKIFLNKKIFWCCCFFVNFFFLLLLFLLLGASVIGRGLFLNIFFFFAIASYRKGLIIEILIHVVYKPIKYLLLQQSPIKLVFWDTTFYCKDKLLISYYSTQISL